MNQFDFTTLEGWPASTETWQYLQNMILQAQQLALIAGSNFILSGCTENGNNVGSGIIVVNGEVMPFSGGAKQTSVVVSDSVTNRPYYGGSSKSYYHQRSALFGTGSGQVAWSLFQRIDGGLLSRLIALENLNVSARLDKVEKMLKPLLGYTDTTTGNTVYGSWLFWGRPASEIPTGWEAVPDADWKGRVPVVMDSGDVDFATVGNTGGEKTHVLSAAEVPILSGDIQYEMNGTDGSLNNGMVMYNGNTENHATGTKTGIITVNRGGGGGHNNMPPFKVVMFIRFIG